MKKLMIISLFLLVSNLSYSQFNSKKDREEAKNTMYIELGGVGKAMYSINYDRIIANSEPSLFSNLSLVVKTGILFPSSESNDSFKDKYVFPVELAIWSGKDGHLELGMGQVFIPKEKILAQDTPPYIRMGYRYQCKEGGLMFRLSLVSNLLKEGYHPYLGIGLGYSF